MCWTKRHFLHLWNSCFVILWTLMDGSHCRFQGRKYFGVLIWNLCPGKYPCPWCRLPNLKRSDIAKSINNPCSMYFRRLILLLLIQYCQFVFLVFKCQHICISGGKIISGKFCTWNPVKIAQTFIGIASHVATNSTASSKKVYMWLKWFCPLQM